MAVARIMYAEAAAWYPRVWSARATMTPTSDEEKTKPSREPATISAIPTSTMRRSGMKSPRVPYRKQATPRTMPGIAVMRPEASPAPMSWATRR